MKLLIELDEEYVKAIDKIRFLVGGRTDRKLQLEIIKAIKNGKPLEQEPATKNDLAVDCISRAEAIKCLECDFDITGKENMKTVVNYINSAHDKIVNLPRVKQEPKTGHWIEEFVDTEGEVRFTCSCCGKYQLFGTDFCYNCGAKMEEVEE